MEKIKYGVLHYHNENSLLDGANKTVDAVAKVVEYGGKALALTNHGTLVGIEDFYRTCKKAGIKPIIGCELYVKEENSFARLHLIIMAKDYAGLCAIQKILTKSNKRVEKVGKLVFPCSTFEILKEYIGEGSLGYGHVVVTSACMGGVITGIAFDNNKRKEELKGIELEIFQLNEYSKVEAECLKDLNKVRGDLNAAKGLAKKTFKKEINSLEKKRKAGEDISEEEKTLYEKINQAKMAEEAIPKIEEVFSFHATKLKSIKDKKPKTKLGYDALVRQANLLKSLIFSDESLYQKMKEEALKYQQLAGEGNFYLELQNHGIEDEITAMPMLVQISKETGIPVVAANDVHIVNNSEDDIKRRAILQTLRFNNEYNEPKVGDDQLYIKTDDELRYAISQIASEDKTQEAMENIGVIINECNLEFETAEHYPVFDKNKDSNELIRKMTYERISEKFKEGEFTQEYQDRVARELDVICNMGYADYHLIVQDFLNIGRNMGKLSKKNLAWLKSNITEMTAEEITDFVSKNAVEAGLTIGPGRGSAAGSLVCFILGITSIDPIKYNLLFERFLNVERISMPDIDSDFANGIRELVVEYVKIRYGIDAVCGINTEMTYGAKGAVRASARSYGLEKTGDKKEFIALAGQISKVIPSVVGTTLSNSKELLKIFDDDEDAKEIIRGAFLIENYVNSYSSHAAGVIISDNDDVSDYVSLALDPKTGTWKAQCNMVETELKGLLKMDFLGLKNLNVITQALKLTQDRHGKLYDLETMPIDNEVIKNIYGKGRTNSVFQVESAGMTNMNMELKPDNIEDIIMGIAAYRPGPMDSIPKIIATKNGKEPLTYMVPELEPILNVTYGSIIYQEQVMRIFQDLAGYSLGQADIVRKAMSKKKVDLIEKERPYFYNGDPLRNIHGCKAKGISEEKTNEIFDTMIEFAKYAFNKSHAAAYAVVSYQTAWLKHYYPLEYYASVLTFAQFKKFPSIMNECKKMGISFLPPDVNTSESEFSIIETEDGSFIQFGLSGIKGINDLSIVIEERSKAPFKSFPDFVKRIQDKTIIENFIKTGSFDRFNKNRKALLMAYPIFMENAKELKKNESIIESNKKMIEVLKSKDSDLDDKTYLELKGFKIKSKKAPTIQSLLKKIDDVEDKLFLLNQRYEEIEIPDVFESKEEKLSFEKELLGVFLSGHPLDSYKESEYYNCLPIDKVEESKKWQSVMGIVTEVEVKQRKADGAPMAFLKIEDKTGEIQINCFTKAYAKYSHLLVVGSILKFTGNVEMKEVYNPDAEDDETVEIEYEPVLSANEIESVDPEKGNLLIEVEDMLEWATVLYPQVIRYEDTTGNGYRILIHDQDMSEIRETSITVNEEFANVFPCTVI